MTDAHNLGLAPNRGLLPAPEPSDPVWVIVRATVHRPGLPRDTYATVDLIDPQIQHELRAGWIIPLPANQQPRLSTDPETGLPVLEVDE